MAKTRQAGKKDEKPAGKKVGKPNKQAGRKAAQPVVSEPLSYHVYLLRCEGGELYVGITTDLERRFEEHAEGGAKGAKYTKTHPPVRFEATWEMPDRRSASALEYRLKRLSHAKKEAIVADPEVAASLVAESRARARI